MSWHWQPTVRQGAGQIDTAGLGLDQHFTAQGDAESWLGESYPDLMAAGVESVSLYEEDRLVYGPMRLEPEV
ncbi:hypothetical protein FOE78_18740 [Microlunatus elymi]|uniref:Uncharacterized protein n=1 Tax=Microlunatus elymi TaxID=2596828 RepID=A0A516Q2L2_9ACTN|nr:hypothetical protein [Microlunatus elymi]QDP97675.1 hypothetical protein FOE78_18740 [Microlunatus elymi]